MNETYNESRNDVDSSLRILSILKISSIIKDGDISNCKELILKNRNI